MTNHGVLAGGRFLAIDVEHNGWFIHEEMAVTLEDHLDLAIKHKLTHLWVMTDTGVVPNQAFYATAGDWPMVASWKYGKDFPLPEDIENELIQVTARKERRQVSVCFPHNSHWDWGRESSLTPKDLLRIVAYLEKALGVPVGAGPSGVGTRYLEKVLSRYPQWLEVPEIDLHTLPFNNDAAKNVIWDRQPTQEELGRKYLVKIDKNSAYPRACVEEMFGGASIRHVDGSKYDNRFPGVWLITVLGEDRADLPQPLWKDAEWVATPIVKMLIKMGYAVEVHEGWAFTEEVSGGKIVKNYHGVLKQWAESLWDIRKGFSNESLWKSAYARKAAGDAIKNILNMTIGVTKFDKYERPCYQKRPDWNVQVVAGARAAMFYNMLKFEREGHGTPLMVYIDALLYASDEPMPFADNRTSLGGYKHEWSLPMTDEVKAILTSKKPRNAKLRLLNELAEKVEVSI